MKVGFGRSFKLAPPQYLIYADLWALVNQARPVATMPVGLGTYDRPYMPLGIADWFWLSQQPVGPSTVYVKVANRLIAKWGADAGHLKSYTSDVTDVPKELLHNDVKGATRKVVDDNEKADADRGYDVKKEPVYTRKARRVEKVYASAATMARQLLWGHDSGDDDAVELANTMAGLLISEGGIDRDASKGGVFMTSFMLLDLIERQVPYGQNGQRYTWASMLMHAGRPDQPAPNEIPGRKPKPGDQRLGRVAKHPMAGLGTVQMGKTISQNTANEARNRIVSIATAWLANYLAEKDDDKSFEYFYVRSVKRDITQKTASVLKPYEHLRQLSLLAMQTRAVSTACLLRGDRGATLKYRDVAVWK